MDLDTLSKKAYDARLKCAELCILKGKGHLTSVLSCAEIVATLYYHVMNLDRDRFVMSKNHGSAITYPILCDLGFISEELLNSYQDDGSVLGTHSRVVVPGVDFAGGSLGIGLGVACGYSIALKTDGKSSLGFCLVGDCECHEGSIWESIMFAGHNHLDNLIMIIDQNGEGSTDFVENLVDLRPLSEKLNAFGWDTFDVSDGHNLEELTDAFAILKNRTSDKPLCFIINTIKGHGIPFMEHVPWLHGSVPKGEKGDLALEYIRGL